MHNELQHLDKFFCPIWLSDTKSLVWVKMRPNLAIVLALCASFFGSFFMTLWLTAAPDVQPPAPTFRPEVLTTLKSTSNAELLKKLSAFGFRENSDITGHIDEFANQPNRSVRIAGWAVDPSGGGNGLSVFVYVDGEPRLTVKTTDSREDVAKAFKLPENVARNIGFSGTFTCETTARAMVLAINVTDGRYMQLDQRQCPWAF